MRDREEKVWRRLGKKNENVRLASRKCSRLWGGDMGLERVGRDREGTREVHKVGFGSREKDPTIYDKRGEQEG